jgi:NAD(P)-dependent dehydrogenase (short-subunit alcohol dehydrogenase family)
VALVTGAAAGIGRACAELLAASGAKVVVADTARAGGEETVELIRAAGGEAAFIEVDVTDEEQVAGAVRFAVDTYGSLDIAHNNAGIIGSAVPLDEVDTEEWLRVLAVNLTGVFLCMKHEGAHMRALGGGSIINTASEAAIRGSGASSSPYVASKHGVAGLTRRAALDWARIGIRVNAICPGMIETPMVQEGMRKYPERVAAMREVQPIGRMGAPSEIAEAVLWLASDAASLITGHLLVADGGWAAI